ncbi:universal stress protein [Halomontanus rarus]|uniref:universal stress protein n=1 Tax=Halomontanus rarus TaxID=3034020 RepID=UPI001A98C8CC
MADPGPERVLVPTVGKPRENDALEYALERFTAEITLLAVVTPLDATMSEGGVLERDEERLEGARRQAESLLEAVEVSEDDRRRIAIATAEGRPGNAIPEFASSEGVDHVVMRGRDSSGLARRLLGRGIATTVVERVDVPVTVLE